MDYLAVIDHEHLDNGMFLSAMARSLSRQSDTRPVLVHGDSAYTERIIQTGVMRDEATVRSIKDLNIRLVALLADEGIAAIGINGYQRSVITLEDGELQLDRTFLERLPAGTVLLISSLVLDTASGQPVAVSLPRVTELLASEMKPDELFLFDRSEKGEILADSFSPATTRWRDLDPEFRRNHIPEEFGSFRRTVRLTTPGDLQNLPDLSRTKKIEGG